MVDSKFWFILIGLALLIAVILILLWFFGIFGHSGNFVPQQVSGDNLQQGIENAIRNSLK